MTIDYDTTHERVDLAQLAELYRSVGWNDRASEPERIAEAVRNSLWIVTAWESGKLVGFCRAFSDGAFTAYVGDVLVNPTHQGRGVGRELVRRLMADRDRIAFVLKAAPPVQPFYAKLGFAPAPDMFRRPRSH